jgi:hypothetical protein
MANTDFMRFSLGVFTREQTRAFLDKIIGWERRGIPSQFSVMLVICRRAASPEKNGMKIEKKTVFRGFPTLVFAISRKQWLAEDGDG